ncbi:hypothetical protein FYK55_10955 [Roseiconus nitratireducens]|uniref:Uncharacterized protein n=1 Tax=Roseiconus nitratireducens TaxID=2605748 RepID=A0A5M6D828_9BACT|nr:hypothetical protein [Roseiconus nitratireducens]KAA5543704.1 hypothetical protein FYK55_10955 [Roseiconus nitratireducens]
MTFESESQAGSVAVVAWQAMPAVFPQSGRGVGGLETAAWTFAKGLAQRTDWSPAMVFRSRQPLPADRVGGFAIG